MTHQPLLTNANDIIISTQSFGILRKALYENIGKTKAKGFLLRFGKEIGMKKAQELKKKNPSKQYLLEMSTNIHTSLGHVSTVITGEKKLNSFSEARGKWMDSFEVDLHLAHHGQADECSCHTLSGFASGYLTEVYEKEIFVKEVTCRSKGDHDCSFIVQTKDYWLNLADELPAIYDDQTIYDELQLTYDRLLEQKDVLHRVTQYHSQLTESVAKGNSLSEVVQSAFDVLQIPIIITDITNQPIILKGLDEQTYQSMMRSKKIKQEEWRQQNATTHVKMGRWQRLSTPVFLKDQKFATCSFIYTDEKEPTEDDYLFLERLATVSALCFLNEKVSFETAERLKISVLDRLINREYQSIEEVTSQFKYIAPNISGPFTTLSVRCVSSGSDGTPVNYYDILLRLSEQLKQRYLYGFLSVRKETIIVLLYGLDDESYLQRQLNKIMQQLQYVYESIQFKVGISLTFDHLEQFHSAFTQSENASKIPRPSTLIYYRELGILGRLLKDADPENLAHVAADELGSLVEPGPKNRELLYTLYIYLKNGGKLQETMQALSLSIGGIQYRIRKIEEKLGKDLKDFTTSSYLLLIIEALLAMGYVVFDERRKR